VAAEQQALSDLDLNQALDAHLAWYTRLESVIEGKSGEALDVSIVSQDNCCALGKWIYGPARQNFAHLPDWELLRLAHAHFHLCAGEVLKAHQKGDQVAAINLLRGPLLHASQKNRDALVRLFATRSWVVRLQQFLHFDAGSVKKYMVWYTLVILSAIMLIGESAVQALSTILPPMPDWYETILNTSLITLIAFPVLYFQVVRPLMSNIRARKLAEDDLRVSAVAFETNQCIMVLDANETVLKVNRAYTATTGYTMEDVAGHVPRMVETSEQDVKFFAEIREQARRTGSWRGEMLNRRKNGQVYLALTSVIVVYADDGSISNYVVAFSDLTEQKAAEKEINDLAFYDMLTGLPNRRMLLDRLGHAVALSNRTGRQDALLHIDLDNFKTLNDTLGHGKGDMMLQQVAARIRACIRDCDTVARIGGDEFTVILEGLHKNAQDAKADAEVIAKKILASLARPYHLGERNFQGSASIGIALFGEHAESAEDLLRRADLAMHEAKASGRNMLRFFDLSMQKAANSRAAMEADLRHAIVGKQLQLFYQPQVNDKRQIIGAEALIRWNHPARGLVSPFEFIPLAEEIGLILPIGQWVLETACAQIKAWEAQEHTRSLELAINVSPLQFRQVEFVDQVRAVLKKNAIQPNRLKIELTESMMFDNIEDTIVKMRELKELGVRFSMDDFGTGYSSLSYLTRLPLDQLKIDQSFVRNIGVQSNDAVIVQTIIGMTHNLGMTVIAEGVETESQRDFLARNGCMNYQGYLFSRPVPLVEFERLFVQPEIA